jgi:hypothetical protein
MSNAKIRHRRLRRARRNALPELRVVYTHARDLDWCYEDTHAGRTAPAPRRAYLSTVIALAALASLGVR